MLTFSGFIALQKTATAHISLLRSYPHNAWSFWDWAWDWDWEWVWDGIGVWEISGFYLSSLAVCCDVIYDNLCSVNVAGRPVDRCLSLGSCVLRLLAAGCLAAYINCPDFYRWFPPAPSSIDSLSLGISTVFGTASSPCPAPSYVYQRPLLHL